MTIRERVEQMEAQRFSPYASLSQNSKGRERPEVECDIRPCYQRDRDRILHSKSFRRMKQKTQVFVCPYGDHYRTRLTHTLEVAQTARTIARALCLNEDLTEAIALGHDLGHTPFGHSGERALDKALNGTGLEFDHASQSIRVVEKLEKDGEGLNLTWEVRDGILNHGTACTPATLEGKIVRICDKIAYVNHDIDDAVRAGILKLEELPKGYTEVLGETSRQRLNGLIHDIVIQSEGKDDIIQSESMHSALMGMRQYLYEHVYTSRFVKAEDTKVERMLGDLYEYYGKHWEEMSEEYIEMLRQGEKKERVVCDYIAGMTDSFAVRKFEEIYVPKFWG